MVIDDDRAYFARRAREEAVAARLASDVAVKRAHEQMEQTYRLASGSADAVRASAE